MARYPNGQPVRISGTVRDLTGTLTNAGAITLTVSKPDATTQTYSSPTNDGTGLYHQDIPASDLTQNGHYQYAWTSTGVGAGVAVGDFDVFDPFEVAILPLQDAKDMLNIPQATTTWDSELLGWIASIQSSLERFTGGPVINTSITERVEAVQGLTKMLLRQRPVVSVTSITSESSGGSLSLADIKIDTNAGTLQRALGLPFYGPFFMWQPWFLVTYVAGWGTSVPAAFNLFGRIVIQHLWETQRGPAALPMVSEETVNVPGFGYAIPNRAAELLNGSQGGVPFTCEAYV
jgi:hypothetical protein